MKTVYVITWSYHDKSGFGVVAVRETNEEAERLKQLIVDAGVDKEFEIHKTDMEKA